jgi:hypothetical protein
MVDRLWRDVHAQHVMAAGGHDEGVPSAAARHVEDPGPWFEPEVGLDEVDLGCGGLR